MKSCMDDNLRIKKQRRKNEWQELKHSTEDTGVDSIFETDKTFKEHTKSLQQRRIHSTIARVRWEEEQTAPAATTKTIPKNNGDKEQKFENGASSHFESHNSTINQMALS